MSLSGWPSSALVQVDCVSNAQICRDQKIHAFPTLRLFRYDTPLPPDYNTVRSRSCCMESRQAGRQVDLRFLGVSFVQDRTVQALKSYVTRKLNVEEKRKNWPDRDKEYKEHPGCMVSKEQPHTFRIPLAC